MKIRGGGGVLDNAGGLSHASGLFRSAFTLAEVLITLGIIGVVAAMTLPTLVQNHRNKVVETRLAKFYSTFNNAIRMAEVEYGDRKIWYSDTGGVDLDEEGKPIEGTAKIDEWFQKYFSNLIVIKKVIKTNGVLRYYLSDGSSFQFGNDDTVLTSREIVFFTGHPDKCPQDGYGICKFQFEYYPIDSSTGWKYLYNKGLEPVKVGWDGNRNTLLNDSRIGCNTKARDGAKYCTAIIQLNNWIIPEDYPFKVRY